MTDIKRIIEDNSKMSEDLGNIDQATKGVIEFNKSFQKNLKVVEQVFEKNPKTMDGNSINLSIVQKDKKEYYS